MAEDVYRTYYDQLTGKYLGAYRGPDADNPYDGHPSVDGQMPGHTSWDGTQVIYDLDSVVRRAIIEEGTRRIESFVMGSLLEVGIVLYLVIKKATGRAWVQAETDQAKKSFTKFQYVAQVYQTAVNAIATIDTLTEQEKLNFNASTDITWPTEPT